MSHEPEMDSVIPTGDEPERVDLINHHEMVIDMREPRLITIRQLRTGMAGV